MEPLEPIQVIEGYGAFYSDCIYEVPLLLQSFHLTKVGAYKAMRAQRLRHYQQWSDQRQTMSSICKTRIKKGEKEPDAGVRYAVQVHHIKIYQ